MALSTLSCLCKTGHSCMPDQVAGCWSTCCCCRHMWTCQQVGKLWCLCMWLVRAAYLGVGCLCPTAEVVCAPMVALGAKPPCLSAAPLVLAVLLVLEGRWGFQTPHARHIMLQPTVCVSATPHQAPESTLDWPPNRCVVQAASAWGLHVQQSPWACCHASLRRPAYHAPTFAVGKTPTHAAEDGSYRRLLLTLCPSLVKLLTQRGMPRALCAVLLVHHTHRLMSCGSLISCWSFEAAALAAETMYDIALGRQHNPIDNAVACRALCVTELLLGWHVVRLQV
jgi:hypothetical protein